MTVSFTDRSGKKYIGVLVNFVGSRWVVQTIDGKTWRCPERMLKEEKSVKGADKVLVAGDGHMADRKERKDEYKAKKVSVMVERIKSYGFQAGQRVKVYTNMGWDETTIVSVNMETGKLAVVNPKYMLFQTFKPLMHPIWDADRIASMERKKQVTTVWADRVVPVR